ncbi:MAG: AAA family ATPase [Candidatus Thorarchaeota archaeon]|nr:AAA family ATPase [Candidatus Thorarchaeota archaeon]
MILPSGLSLLDRILNGGLGTGIITHIYGEAAAGKTTLALKFVGELFKQKYGTIYINSENTSPVERLQQITGKTFEKLELLVKILAPKGFSEQGVLLEDLELYIRNNTKLIVVDTLTKYYRLALEDKKTNYSNHRELNRQTGLLKGLSQSHDIAVLILNQVTARMHGINDFEPVAGNIMDYWSDYVIKMKIGRTQGARILERLVPEGKNVEGQLYLTNDGFSMNPSNEKE